MKKYNLVIYRYTIMIYFSLWSFQKVWFPGLDFINQEKDIYKLLVIYFLNVTSWYLYGGLWLKVFEPLKGEGK